MSEKKKHEEEALTGQPEQQEEHPLLDVFPDESFSDTRRMSLEDLPDVFAEAEEEEEDDLEIEPRDYRPIRTRRDGKLGCLGGLMYAVFVISIAIILACFGWMAASDVLALNKEDLAAVVTLPEEIFSDEEIEVTDSEGKVTGTKTVSAADIDYVTDELKSKGLIEYKWLFKLYAKVSHASRKMAPGTYELGSNLDYRALVRNMQGTESRVVVTLTFPEGYTMKQIFDKLEENEVCSAQKLYEAAATFNYSFAFLEDAETGEANRLEGYIFPDTYDFYLGEQPSSVINKFLTALHGKITADMWKQCENLGITFREAVTIGSMIEKEAADDSERAFIASVIYNRLAANMPLGVDATILYEFPDYDGGVNLPESIRLKESPYNTLLNTGLPPTPICNPGIASIKAALQPESTNYYYYALDVESGTHRFFTNYNDFQAFTATQNYD